MPTPLMTSSMNGRLKIRCNWKKVQEWFSRFHGYNSTLLGLHGSLPSFELQQVNTGYCTSKTNTGKISGLFLRFSGERLWDSRCHCIEVVNMPQVWEWILCFEKRILSEKLNMNLCIPACRFSAIFFIYTHFCAWELGFLYPWLVISAGLIV